MRQAGAHMYFCSMKIIVKWIGKTKSKETMTHADANVSPNCTYELKQLYGDRCLY